MAGFVADAQEPQNGVDRSCGGHDFLSLSVFFFFFNIVNLACLLSKALIWLILLILGTEGKSRNEGKRARMDKQHQWLSSMHLNNYYRQWRNIFPVLLPSFTVCWLSIPFG